MNAQAVFQILNELIKGYLGQDKEKWFSRFTIMSMKINCPTDTQNKIGKICWNLHDAIINQKERHPILEYYFMFYNETDPKPYIVFYWCTVRWILLLLSKDLNSPESIDLSATIDFNKIQSIDKAILLTSLREFPAEKDEELAQELIKKVKNHTDKSATK